MAPSSLTLKLFLISGSQIGRHMYFTSITSLSFTGQLFHSQPLWLLD